MKEKKEIQNKERRSVSRKKMFRLFFSFVREEFFFFLAQKKTKKYIYIYMFWFFVAAVCITLILVSFHSIKKYSESSVIISESEIIKRVEKLTTVPQEVPLSIVRVENADILRNQNVFYRDIQEGDYIIMYKGKAIIYDVRKDSIKKETK